MSRVLLVGWGFPPDIDGGLDIHVYNLFNQLKEAESIEVALTLPEERAPEKDGIIPVASGSGSIRWRAMKMSSHIAEIAKNYDIIHTHDWFGAEAGFKAKKYSDCKWVSTFHSTSSDRTRGESQNSLEEVAVQHSDTVLAVSRKLSNEIKEVYGYEPEVVRNGFSKPESSGKYVKKQLGIQNKMVFFVGRHAEQKGIEHLLYGFKKFLEDEVRKVTLVIGGEGEMKHSLEEFASLLGIEGKVQFTGFIPQSELGDYYSSADLFVSPSVSEPFGLTITEALQAGTPVAATENGVEEIIPDEYITSIEPESDSIAEGIKQGLKQPNNELSEVRTWQDMTEEVMQVYSDLS